ncbi:hypothetical protein [Paractinoplanes lichenicola]|uniref:Uncharacterized protein n=1 Tax=Paractinoplanes lichenicola TaxID=2802976 RepID=A0ABS1VLA4_9ACTN|nr:hypothetical protein [Actinoplanes lichenicola]MBL7255438.1 hypothetical protein [Actinoplanes lichenicola]
MTQDERAVAERDHQGTLWLINGILAGVGGVFLTTGSVPVTLIAAAVAVVISGMALMTRR